MRRTSLTGSRIRARTRYWKQWSIEAHFSEITVPQLTIAAWYDIFQDGSIRNYVGVKARGATEAARRGQHLLVAVGGHAGDGPKIGEVDFGPDSHFDYEAATLAWYDYLFKDARNEFAGKPVKIFVMGANQWREEDDWPLARAQATRYFLHSTGKANSLRGNGTLSTAAPGRRKRRISTFTIPRTPRRPLADRSAVTASTCRRVRAINVRSKRERMCSCTRPRHSRRIWKSPAR